MLIIGLTGGIGSGKSTVANLFATLGIPIIDTDIIARQVVEPGQPALQEIKKTFGHEVLTDNGALNRPVIRKIIFNDPSKRKQLEGILHPRILNEMLQQARSLTTPYCIFVIPLLIEAQQQTLVDRILVVDCEDKLRRKHLKLRDNMTDAEIDKVFAAQADRHQRLAQSDDVIHNNKDLDHLRSQVSALHSRYSLLAGKA